jgi:hypothetical protein
LVDLHNSYNAEGISAHNPPEISPRLNPSDRRPVVACVGLEKACGHGFRAADIQLEVQRIGQTLGNRHTHPVWLSSGEGRREPGYDSLLGLRKNPGVHLGIDPEKDGRVDQDRAAPPGLGAADRLSCAHHQGVGELIEEADW